MDVFFDTIWDKVSTDINEINSKPVYIKSFLKTKIKSHSDKFTDNYDKKYVI